MDIEAKTYWQIEISGLPSVEKHVAENTALDWDGQDESEEPFGDTEDVRDVIACILFENFACEGVVLEEETFKEFKRTGKSPVVKAFFSEMPNIDDVRTVIFENITENIEIGLTLTQVEEKDWSEEWKKNWQPSKISEKIVICPTWRTYEPQENDVVVNLDPGSAFGTGSHATTQLCVKAIEKYMPQNAEVADIGCGSGILAICAVKLGAKSAVGVDNDPTVIAVADDNAVLNNVEDKTKFFEAVATNLIGHTYDFVCANILHNVLNAIMGELKQLVKDTGHIVLSGILDEKEHIVQAAIEREGLQLVERLTSGNWVGLVVKDNGVKI